MPSCGDDSTSLRHLTVPDPGQKGRKTGADLAIAAIAIAIANDSVVVSGNAAHVAQIHACFPLAGIHNPFVHG